MATVKGLSMRKAYLLSASLVLAALLAPMSSSAEDVRIVTLFNGITADATSIPISAKNCPGGVAVQIRSASTSAVVVSIQTSLDNGNNWTTAVTVTNPTSSGEIWLGPGVGWVRLATNGTYGSGTITATAMPVGPNGSI